MPYRLHLGAVVLLSCLSCSRAPVVPGHVGPYRVGVSRSSKSFLNEDGKLDGLYIDVFRAAAARAGVPFDFIYLENGSIDAALAQHIIDLHVAAADLPARHRPEVYLADPWWASPLVTVVPRQSPIRALNDLRGQLVAVGTASAGYWELVFPLAVPGAIRLDVPAPVSPIESLCTGKAAAALTVGPDAEQLLGSRPGPCRDMDFRFLRVALAKVHYALMSRAELKPVVDVLNAEIREMAADGTLARISSPWLGLNSSAADELGQSVIARRRLTMSLTLLAMVGVALLSLLLGGLLWHERRVGRRLEAAFERARRGEQAKAQFLAMMSHEIRTPLNGVLGMTEIMLTTPLNPEQLEAAKTIQRSSAALLTVLNDILDLAKFEAGEVRINPEAFPLRLLLDDVTNLLALSASAKHLGLYVEVAADVPDRIVGDPARLRQILLNLAGNAVKFTDRGRVYLRIRREPGAPSDAGVRLRFAVEDTGPGVRADQLPLLFQRFTQLDASPTRRHGGVGLGLAISKTLVEAMGGRIEVTSKAGAGSTFAFTVNFAVAEASPLPLAGRRVRIAGADPDQVRCLQLLALAAGAEMADGAADGDAASLWVEPSGDRIVDRPDDSTCIVPASARLLQGPVSYSTLVATLAAAPEPAARAVQPEAQYVGWRVLVAEDNAVNRRLLSALLVKLGCTVLEACDGEQAVELWRTARPDLVLMDCQMPGMDGYEATRRIRNEEPADGPRTCIWAVTANVLAEDRQRCRECGMDDVLAKPFTLALLESTLRNVFGASAATAVRRAG